MSPAEIEQAIDQLNQTERGRKVIEHLYAMLNDGGISLDSRNQQAVVTILCGAWGKYSGTTLELLEASGAV
jgi:hypothetical protein